MYDIDGLTGRQIAQRTGMSPRTVIRRLHASGAILRNAGDPIIHQLVDREWLEREYVGKGRVGQDIADEIGCSTRTVFLWLERHGIQPRPAGSEKGHQRNDSPEVREKMSVAKRDKFIGSDNPNWRGGSPFVDPDRGRYRSKMWVKAVKDRDGWKCTKCGAEDRLHSHHIKRWMDYPDLRYDVTNGVTLCHPCHEEAHGHGFKFRFQYVKCPTSAPVPE